MGNLHHEGNTGNRALLGLEGDVAMSLFLQVDRIAAPLLLIHGEVDETSGTRPLQSVRFFDALRAHGKVARLVVLPHEGHAYQARESVLHVLWEMAEWLE